MHTVSEYRDGTTMLNPQAAAEGGSPSTETIQSRFGEITVDTSRSIAFPRGLLGLPEKANFVVANFPSQKMQQFKVLQSLDEPALSFITLPVDIQNPIISLTDLRTACTELQIAEADLAVLLIVSVHRSPDQVKLSVNARAPLLLDANKRVGVQYVFQSDAYKVQHMLG